MRELPRRVRQAFVLVALLAIGAWAALVWWRGRDIGPVQRGWRVASSRGCLACHGPAGQTVDPDRGIGGAPAFDHEAVTAYSRNPGEIRDWILDGGPKRIRDLGQQPALLRMPAWRGRLSAREVDDLVAWIEAASDFEAAPDDIAAGRDVAARTGCFACHGPQGRGDSPNPGSLKGYVPSWSGPGFGDLVRNDSELRDWILDGSPRRLREHPVAAFFIRRQLIQMPAFRDKLSEPELGRIVAYIHWLRQPPAARAR
jgi:mono/diheme cytochrome c family protein